MDKILNSNLKIDNLYPIFYELSPAEAETVVGGGFIDGYPNLYISTVHGDINSPSTTYEGAGSSHDNKYNTLDYSRSTYIWIAR